jgi:hypothetical protein
MQWVAQQQPGEAPLVLALRASAEVTNRLAGRPLALAAETESSGVLMLGADIEIAADDWFVYRAQEVAASNELGLGDDSAVTPLLSVGTEACDCELMIDFAVPAQPPKQYLGFLRVGRQE